ncbi:MAG: molybdate ABC transporter substrate-binding protein [Verrucomicrobiota bacterium]
MNSALKVFLLSLLAGGALVLLLYWHPGEGRRGQTTGPLLVYCAAGLKPPVEAVARQYEKECGVAVQLQYGGSGTLLSNLRVAARGDVFLAGDESYIELARSNGLVVESIPIGRMGLVVAVRRGNPKGVHSLGDLVRADVRLALGNPDAAAVGKLGRELLEQTGDWAAIEARAKVFKPTVNDLANDVKLGAADAALVWDATVSAYPELEAVKFPPIDRGEQRVTLGVLRCSRQPTAALHFARYLTAGDRGLGEFRRAGYRVTEGDVWAERPEVLLYSGGVNRLAVEDTIRQFEEREGVKVTRVYNGCGILVSQIKAGQRPDAYLACDVSFLTPVAEFFGEPVEISETAMVLLVAKGNPRQIRSLADLAQPGLRLGVANARQSTLGDLTAKLLRGAQLFEAVMANVKTQTPTADLLVNEIRTGALDAVVVYAANTSQVRGVLEMVPLNLAGAKAVQPYAVGKNSGHRLLMERLRAALQSEESRRRYEGLGFQWRGAKPSP